MPQEVTDASFESLVLDRSERITVVVEFWAPWCGPSKALEPILNQAVSEAIGGICLLRLNVDQNPLVCSTHNIQSIPTVIAFCERSVFDRFVGAGLDAGVRKFIGALPARPTTGLLDVNDSDQESQEVPGSKALQSHSAELLAASHCVVAAISLGRRRLTAACAQRESEAGTLGERQARQTEEFGARIHCLVDYAVTLESLIQDIVRSTDGGEHAFSASTQRAKSAPDQLPVDAVIPLLARPQLPLLAEVQLRGDGVKWAAQAIQGAVAAAAKRQNRVNRGGLVDALVIARSVALTARAKSTEIATEQTTAAVALARERYESNLQNDQAVKEAVRNLEQSVDEQSAAYRRLLDERPPVARSGWEEAEWDVWCPPTVVEPVSLGTLICPPEELQPEFSDIPTYTLGITDDIRRLGGIVYTYNRSTRATALSASRSLVARLLASIPPGKARFTFFDPLGLGESVAPFLALADHDQKLIDGKVWSSAEELRTRLSEHMSHIEIVIQKYLRGEFQSIEDYNVEAGEIAEPYRFLFVYDYPSQFDDTTIHQLARIIQNGPRCGVYTVLVANADVVDERLSIQALPPLTILTQDGPSSLLGGPPMTFSYDIDPIDALGTAKGQALIDRIVDSVGRAGRGTDNVTVDLPKALRLHGDTVRAGVRADLPADASPALIEDPSTWWANTTVEAVAAPIGQSGARDVALLRFDSEILSGGLLVGRPGAGKSTLLHSYIGALCSLYPPSELELYLIDFKEGVEFKAYAETGLPHARCVAVESEREFGLSVLESIVDEMKKRAALIRATGGEKTTFARLREALDQPLPRIVLVFDEFHVLFSEDDKVGAMAANHLETIVRQGRGFGVHVLLGSQSLAGLDALGRHVLQLLPIRILLPSSESDAHLVLGDGNDAWRTLNRRGEGILNTAAGAPEGNVPFQTAFEPEEQRFIRLQQLRRKADDAGFIRRPMVFEGYSASDVAADFPNGLVDQFIDRSSLILPLRVGTPMSLCGPVDIELRREGGANVLIVARGSQDVPLAIVLMGIASAASSPAHPRIEFVDFTAVDEGVEDTLKPLQKADLVSLTRRRAAERTIGEHASEVARRVAEDDVRAPAILLVLYGLHRARALDPEVTPDPFETDSTGDMLTSIRQILVNGPEVGVHVMAWADSVTSLARRLPRSLRREFGTVIAGSMSRDDSMELIDSDAASSLRPHQIAVYNDDAGTIQRGRSFSVPTAEWLDTVSSQVYKEDRP